MSNLAELIEPFGAPPSSLVELGGGPKPESIQYLDLLERGTQSQVVPDGVIEVERQPLACLVNAADGGPLNLPSLRRKLALRGDIPYLAVTEPGRITVYSVALDHKDLQQIRSTTVSKNDRAAETLFLGLYFEPWAEQGQRRFVHELVFELMTKAIGGLRAAGIQRNDAISLAGRALFLRFLVDRQILLEEDAHTVCGPAGRPTDFFKNPENSASTCNWLDRTFNGDFLPLSFDPSAANFGHLAERAFEFLSNIMWKAPGGQLRFDWGDLDFAHIPVGLLSQVYERQAQHWDGEGQKQRSEYYTPWRIAAYMVSEVFSAIREQGTSEAHQVRVLDPAVGGGVFLVAAFQEIVAAWWRHFGSPPKTDQLRSILYKQLAGFDVSEPALRLSALGLYLKAIELDLDPFPIEKLRFQPLRGRVLHDVKSAEEGESATVLGSLGPAAGGSHAAAYDVVIGNPPWTALRGEDGRQVHKRMTERVRSMAAARLGDDRASRFRIPDQVPDLPFVWQAMEWARRGGWIALALHARLLFKTSPAGRQARIDLFEALEVTGVLNGTALRNTQVWPGVEAPFCILFAVNERPPSDYVFQFASPYLEEQMNSQGRLRIDAKTTQPVSLSRLRRTSHLLKVMFRGNALDASLLEEVKKKPWPTVSQYWRSNRLHHGQGYITGSDQRNRDASFLNGLPNLTSQYAGSLLVDTSRLPAFPEDERLQWPRSPEIYRAPLFLFKESPSADRSKGMALACFQDAAFSRAYYGFSARGHPRGRLLVRYLTLLFHSSVFLWHALVTSSRFGVEREVIQKQDVDGSFPIPPLEELDAESAAEIGPLFQGLATNRENVWEKLDQWAAKVFRLTRWDLETIRDTLDVELPFASARKRAQTQPSAKEIGTFVKRLGGELMPFVQQTSKTLQVRHLSAFSGSPWELLFLGTDAAFNPTPQLDSLFRLADEKGASQIVFPQPGGGLMVAILRQYRYWTPTRARLCALEILQSRLQNLVSGT